MGNLRKFYRVRCRVKRSKWSKASYREVVVKAIGEDEARERVRRFLTRETQLNVDTFGVDLIDYVCRHKYEVALSMNDNWYNSRLVSFDTETTGLENDAQIIELGFSVFCKKARSFVKLKNFLIKPSIQIAEEATKIHGLSNDDLKDCPEFIDIKDELKEILTDNTVLICHHKEFDIPRLAYELHRNKIELDVPPVMCSYKLSEKTMFGQRNHKLKTLIEVLELDESNSHRADDDARASGNVFLALSKKNTDGFINKNLRDALDYLR